MTLRVVVTDPSMIGWLQTWQVDGSSVIRSPKIKIHLKISSWQEMLTFLQYEI